MGEPVRKDPEFAGGGIFEAPLDKEILTSMRSYIDYTLTDRAIPYVDGMKPVHRAILWCMSDMGLKPGAGYRKSASVAGNGIAKFWPHSADAFYLASAGLARQKGDDSRAAACKLNLCLVDGHGNFGASYEDEPAAPRYSEERLSETGQSCVDDVARGAVFMEPTFDAKSKMPQLLPTRMPLLLINGSDGLAYGYNVNWMPHNPVEAMRVCVAAVRKGGEISTDRILHYMPGPDFPSGGIVIDDAEGGLRQAIETGFGSFTLTSRYRVVDGKRGRHVIQFYETPFGVNRSAASESDSKSIIRGVSKFIDDHPEYGMTDVKNLAGADDDCLIEVYVKSGSNPETAAAALLDPASKTNLTVRMAYRQSMVTGDWEPSEVPDASDEKGVLHLVNVRPRDMGVAEYVRAWIDFRRACIRNETAKDERDSRAKAHLLEGTLAVLADIDRLIAIVRKSDGRDKAKDAVMRAFKIDDAQAERVLSIPLGRLTRTDEVKLRADVKELNERADADAALLADQSLVDRQITDELTEEARRHKMARRTTIVSAGGTIVAGVDGKDGQRCIPGVKAVKRATVNGNDDVDEDADNEASGFYSAGPADLFRDASGRVWTGDAKPTHVQREHAEEALSRCLIVGVDGTARRMTCTDVPKKPSIIGGPAAGVVPLGDLGPDGGAAPAGDAIILTASGKVKRLSGTDLPVRTDEFPVIALAPGDSVIWASPFDPASQVTFVTSDAKLLTFPESEIDHAQGRSAGGVAGISPRKGARVIGGFATPAGATVITSTGTGAKLTPLSEFPTHGRGTSGVGCQRMLKGENALTFAFVGAGAQALDADGNDVALSTSPRDSSGERVRGVAGARLEKGGSPASEGTEAATGTSTKPDGVGRIPEHGAAGGAASRLSALGIL